ncbi:hypothetical protein EG68_04801 [Paragonimus skrjabini miyazakii]|uniref:Uncharacterized protein n=1 Tax=Paragonimus skrjabini miyazakii TaxID=59628 RepID=A0A8S9YWQ5_9TREM|nr:hypothetical protein EG68_04801 [Paragonimus skrjabini miyazakii]
MVGILPYSSEMAWWTFRCTHSGRLDLRGPSSSRYRRCAQHESTFVPFAIEKYLTCYLIIELSIPFFAFVFLRYSHAFSQITTEIHFWTVSLKHVNFLLSHRWKAFYKPAPQLYLHMIGQFVEPAKGKET